MRGVYIPYWTFDAQAVCPWEAEAGHYYYTTETYRDNQGRTQTRQVRHVRWEPASGLVEHFFDDEPVPGTHGVSHALLAADRAVPHGRARALRHRVSVGIHRRALPDRAARRRAGVAGCDDAEAATRCAPPKFPATRIAICRFIRRFPAQTFKHILVPVWLLSYLYGTKTYQVVVNGYDGRMAGQYPKSPWKIAFLVLLAIIVFMIFVMLSQNN